MTTTTTPPSDHVAAATPLVDLGIVRGLKRYRDDRLGLLEELGRDRVGLARSRVGSLRLFIVTSAELAQEVLLERAGDYVKSRALRKLARPLLGDGLLSADGEIHKRHRKLLASGFQSRRIGQYAADMVGLTHAMLAGWQAGETRDFAHDITMLTVRIAAATMFGDDDVPADAVGGALEVANRWVMARASSLLALPLAVPTAGNRAMRRALALLDEVVYTVIAKKRARSSETDILSMLLAAQDANGSGGLDDREVRDEVMTFFLAGHETTATALSWMFHVLATHPAIATTLTAELDRVLAGRAPMQADLDELPYLRQLILETLRVYPPAYMIGRQAIVDTELGGHVIPRGSYVLVNVIGIHHRADYYDAPAELRPERFVDGDPPAPRGGYLPFGLGPRVCIGNQFAMMEAGLLAATIFQRARPAAAPGAVERDPLVTLRPRPGLPFVVEWR